MMSSSVRIIPKAPWHLWVVGILGLVWNAGGAFDFVMTNTQNEQYMAAFTPEQLEFFYGFPMWITVTWAVAVWGGVFGCVALLLRKKWAVSIFAASLVAFLITAIHNFGFSKGLEVMGDPASLIFTGVIFLITVALFLYARSLSQKRILN